MGFTWLIKGPTLTIPRCGLNWCCSSRTRDGLGVGETRGRLGGGGLKGGRKGRYLSRRGGVHGRPPRWGPAMYPRLAAEVPLSFHLSPAVLDRRQARR